RNLACGIPFSAFRIPPFRDNPHHQYFLQSRAWNSFSCIYFQKNLKIVCTHFEIDYALKTYSTKLCNKL
ncbi:hypothetical protein BpHYR1_039028, partial [Brachionus plicatilis]